MKTKYLFLVAFLLASCTSPTVVPATATVTLKPPKVSTILPSPLSTSTIVATPVVVKTTVSTAAKTATAVKPMITATASKPLVVTTGRVIYGVQVLDPVNSSGIAVNMGIKLIKIQVRWSQIQQCNQEPNWGTVQSQVDAIRAAGGQVLLSVVTTPPCLNSAGQENLPPDDLQKYANFVGGLASRFRPYAIEVWNEQNLSREWNGPDPAKYIAMLRLAYSSIKTNSPSTLIIAGALSPTWHNPPNHWDDLVYWQEFGKKGGSAYADCVGVHINSLSYSPTISLKNPVGDKNHHSWYFPDTLLGSTLATGLPACITEFGIPTKMSVGGMPATFSWGGNTTLEQQGAWLVEGMKLAEAYGNVKIMVFWNLDFSPACGGCVDEKSIYSLLDKNARALPAYNAIKSALGR